MKAFTDIEQSKKLAEFLPIESADMFWLVLGDTPRVHVLTEPLSNYSQWESYPCWSLAALLEQLPEIINYEDDESDYALEISKENDLYYLSYGNPFEHGKLEVEPQENFVDACVELIETLHEQKLL